MTGRVRPRTRSASELIDQRIPEIGEWRGETLGRMRS